MKSSSTGRKIVMSLSAVFLVLFLTLHLAVNLTALVSRSAYEAACRFMDENPVIQIMVPVLAFGFIVHILYALTLTVRNRRARPVGYEVPNKTEVSWSARNMLVLGLIILGMLGMHLFHFWAKMQLPHFLGMQGEAPYELVRNVFSNGFYVILYVVWILAVCFHLSHGFWSMFQSLGLANRKWIPRLRLAAVIYSHLVMLGFLAIPVYFYFGFGEA